MLVFTIIILARRLIAAIVKEVRVTCFTQKNAALALSLHVKTHQLHSIYRVKFPLNSDSAPLMSPLLFSLCCWWEGNPITVLTTWFFSPSGITKWETLFPSLNIFGNGSVCSADADRLEPVPLSHLPLQNLLCSQLAFPLLPVST